MKILGFLFLILTIPACLIQCLDNGLGLSPPMGWNSWNRFKCEINENLIKQTAQAIIDTGLYRYGYKYINLDDCWQISRDSKGNIIADPKAFPSGIQNLSKFVHSLGLKFGIYSDAGLKTCKRRPGSLGFEKQDAKTYAGWGVDYLKYDNCFTDGSKPEGRYITMRDALNATGRPIFYSMCEWGIDNPALWAKDVANSWRTTYDISDSWDRVLWILDQNNEWADYGKPGGWNDPDMLEVGNGGMTYNEYKSHFALWAFMKAPLIIGCDLKNMSQQTFEILTRSEIIAINQDPTISAGRRYSNVSNLEIWIASSSKTPSRYVLLFNRSSRKETMSIKWRDIRLEEGKKCKVRDLWNEKELGVFEGEFSSQVDIHSSVIVRITPQPQITPPN